jgi:hypothetical protein
MRQPTCLLLWYRAAASTLVLSAFCRAFLRWVVEYLKVEKRLCDNVQQVLAAVNKIRQCMFAFGSCVAFFV